ncbi:MAG: hypothetical protein HY318_07110 [Armatimonadetes bacterium]|nr:hypothetical protein [Armatimonadota bacterium]
MMNHIEGPTRVARLSAVLCFLMIACSTAIAAMAEPQGALTVPAEKTNHQVGRIIDDPGTESGKTLVATPGTDKAGYLIDQPYLLVPPGRYRVAFRLKIDARAKHSRVVVLRVGAVGDPHYRFIDRVLTTADFRRSGEYQDFELEIARPATEGKEQAQLYALVSWEGKETVRVASITVTPLSQPPVLVWKVWPAKILVRPNQEQTFTVDLAEGKGQPQQGCRIRIECVRDLDTVVAVAEQSVSLSPWEKKAITLKWNVGKPQYGYEARATALDAAGKPVDSTSEWFGVSDNSFRLRIASNVPFSFLDPNANDWTISEARKNYATVSELYAWSPGMFCNLYPRKEYWASGQVSEWRYNRTIMKSLISDLHKNGVSVISYDACWFNGAPGMETARQHPEWLQYNSQGRPMGGLDTSVWDIPGEGDEQVPLVPYSSESRNIVSAWPVDDKLMATAADEILLIGKELGFDGVRWDGHPIIWASPDEKAIPGTNLGTGIWRCDGKPLRDLVKDYDAQSLHNMRLIKQRVAKQLPTFEWGYNWGYDVTVNGLPKTWKECVSNGGVWVEGGFRTGDLAAADQKNTWEKFIESCFQSCQLVIREGGYPIHGAFTYTVPSTLRYTYIFSVANGGHPCISDGDNVLRDYYRFVLRYSQYLYDPAIEPWWGKPKIKVAGWCTYRDGMEPKIPPVSQEAAVAGSRPIVWEKLLFHRKTSATTMDTILHLVKAPAKPYMDFTDLDDPPIQEKVKVSVRRPAGMKLDKAWCLSPDQPNMGEPLTPLVSQPGWMDVTVPRLAYWDVVVFQWRKA